MSGRAVITTSRELDVLTAADLVARVRRVAPQERPVDIDLRAVEFIDSFGLRSLMEADRLLRERSAGRPRILVRRRGPVEHLLQLTLLDRTLDVHAGEAGSHRPSTKEPRMKAIVYRGPRSVAVEQVPDPALETPLDAIVRITTTNICGSDLHMYEGRTAVRGHGPRPREHGDRRRSSASRSATASRCP